MLKREALAIVGGLSNPAKMPSKSIGLPAKECNTGSKLAKIENSVCADCYALKGQYQFRNVQDAQYKRLEALSHPQWIQAMVTLLSDQEYFRWHDSGDIQSLAHLDQIMAVIRLTPNTRHWIPTKEKKLIKRWIAAGNTVPTNCVIRLSAPMVGMRINHSGKSIPGIKFSSVHVGQPIGKSCIAYQQDGECRDCRACWSRRIDNISYPKH